MPEEALITPISLEENITSLSAILLDDDYYAFLRLGRCFFEGVSILDAPI